MVENCTHEHGQALLSAGVLFPGQASPRGSSGQCQSCPQQEREAAWPLSLPPREPGRWQGASGKQEGEIRKPLGEPQKGVAGEGERRIARGQRAC